MSITVRFYENFKKRDNSTLLPAAGDSYADYSCVLKDSSSIVNPYIEVALPSQDPHVYNYAYISQYDRYYYVTDWTYSRGVWTTNLVSDVLASFKTEIGNLNKYINRASAEKNGYITDLKYPTLVNPSITYITLDNPFKDNNGCFLIGIVGKPQTNVPSVGGVNYYKFSWTQMREFMTYLTGSTFANLLKDDSAGLTQQVVKTLVNPTDYIESCMWFPFDIYVSNSYAAVQPQIGWWDGLSPITGGVQPLGAGGDLISSMTLRNVSSWNSTITLTNHTQISRGEYLNAEPYSQYILHFEPWGDIVLSGNILMRYNSISLSMVTEGLTGLAALEVWGGSELITRKTAQIGVSMSMAQIITDFSNMSAGSLAIGAAAGIATKKIDLKQLGDDFLKLITGHKISSSSSLGKDALSGIESFNSNVETNGVNGSLISYLGTYVAAQNYFSTGPFLKIVRFNQVSANNHEYGSPLCSTRVIKNIPGYIECADGEHNIAAFDSEKAQISSYLTGGFFYE